MKSLEFWFAIGSAAGAVLVGDWCRAWCTKHGTKSGSKHAPTHAPTSTPQPHHGSYGKGVQS